MSLSCECWVCWQIEVSASGCSPFQKIPTDCGLSECDREASIMRRHCPPRGCYPWTKTRLGKETSALCVYFMQKPVLISCNCGGPGLCTTCAETRGGAAINTARPHPLTPCCADPPPLQYFAGGCSIGHIFPQLKVNNTHSLRGWRVQNCTSWGRFHCILLYWNIKPTNCLLKRHIDLYNEILAIEPMDISLNWWPVEWMNELKKCRWLEVMKTSLVIRRKGKMDFWSLGIISFHQGPWCRGLFPNS